MFGGQGGGLFGGPQDFLGNSVFDNQQTAPRAPAGGYLENGPRSPPVSALLPQPYASYISDHRRSQIGIKKLMDIPRIES